MEIYSSLFYNHVDTAGFMEGMYPKYPLSWFVCGCMFPFLLVSRVTFYKSTNSTICPPSHRGSSTTTDVHSTNFQRVDSVCIWWFITNTGTVKGRTDDRFGSTLSRGRERWILNRKHDQCQSTSLHVKTCSDLRNQFYQSYGYVVKSMQEFYRPIVPILRAIF